MSVIGRSTLVVAMAGAMSAAAHAQEPRKLGITMGYPSGVGIVWQASDTIAVRPALSFGGGSSGSGSSSVTTGTSNWTVGPAIGVLFYMKKYDNVRTYVSPSYRYSHSSTTVHPSSALPGGSDVHSTTNSHGGNGTFGAEYAPGSRVRIYGEVGFGFTHATQSSTVTSVVNATGNSWGTTAGVGLVFYP